MLTASDCVGVDSGTRAAHQQVVVVLGGALNPVHTQHTAALEQAALQLESHGYAVRGCYLAPAPDGYVKRKVAAASLPARCALPGSLRVELCAAAAAECASRVLAPPKTYGSALQCGLDVRREGEGVVVLVGADRAATRAGRKWLKPRPKGCTALGVIGRRGETEELRAMFAQDLAAGRVVAPRTFLWLDVETPLAVSSTMVREVLFSLGSGVAEDGAVPRDCPSAGATGKAARPGPSARVEEPARLDDAHATRTTSLVPSACPRSATSGAVTMDSEACLHGSGAGDSATAGAGVGAGAGSAVDNDRSHARLGAPTFDSPLLTLQSKLQALVKRGWLHGGVARCLARSLDSPSAAARDPARENAGRVEGFSAPRKARQTTTT